MKTIGLIGGMSWESSAEYYRILNQLVATHFGGLASAPLLLHSFDFAQIEPSMRAGDWQSVTRKVIAAGQGLERAGADLIAICTNTVHITADALQEALGVPLVRITDATAEVIKARGLSRVGLLGTKFTMAMDFYRERFAHNFAIEVVVPEEPEQIEINRIVFEELCRGEILDSSRQTYIDAVNQLRSHGAEGVILGCTEIPLLLKESDVTLPLFDTTQIHCQAAFQLALR